MQDRPCTSLTIIAVVSLSFFCSRVQSADSLSLQPSLGAGQVSRIECLLEVTGTLKLPDAGGVKEVAMQATGTSSYAEQLLKVAAKPDSPARSIRMYDQNSAKIAVGGAMTSSALPEDLRFIVADWSGKQLLLFNPQRRLTREQLELLSAPGDSLLVNWLLPEKPVAIGDSWNNSNEVLTGLLGIEAIKACEVASTLREVEGQSARCEMKGKITGAVSGVGTEIEIKAKYTFDLESKRITWIALLIKENRSIGHAAPGLVATSRLQLKIQSSPDFRPVAADVAATSLDPHPSSLLLRYHSQNASFGFDYDRRWQLMSENEKGAVFRYVDQGELIAQLNVLPVRPATGDQGTPLAKFQADIQQALGANFGQFVQASQIGDDDRRLIYRVVATGKSDDLPIQWMYYLLTGPAGEQVLLIFTLEANLVDRFADQDRRLIDSLRFDTKSAKQSVAARPRALR